MATAPYVHTHTNIYTLILHSHVGHTHESSLGFGTYPHVDGQQDTLLRGNISTVYKPNSHGLSHVFGYVKRGTDVLRIPSGLRRTFSFSSTKLRHALTISILATSSQISWLTVTKTMCTVGRSTGSCIFAIACTRRFMLKLDGRLIVLEFWRV